ncbi:uncharacterized protein BDV14DRAFT_207385 [Aspergillus stella-maris]|uniref:uncharacterized protein n=1 Tax=Aspergillus stella-maris TaxID=1810926 RepID=UPI003CCD68C7
MPLRILITGSSDGIGAAAARQLVARGHEVYLHARNKDRAIAAEKACPGSAGILTGDLSNIQDLKSLAAQANDLGPLDAVIHNAGVYLGPFRRTNDIGVPMQVVVNLIAPYILTASMRKPERLVFISSMLHKKGDTEERDLFWFERGEWRWDDAQSYFDSKLQLNAMANGVARRLKGKTAVSIVDPGWVATKLGGVHATDRIEDGVETYVLLAEGRYDTNISPGYFEGKGVKGEQLGVAMDEGFQEWILGMLEMQTGIKVLE